MSVIAHPHSGEEVFAERLMKYALFLRHVGLSAEQIDSFLKDAARRIIQKAERRVGHLVPTTPLDNVRGDSSLN